MNKLVDLHIHSNASDGTCTPQELIDIALKQKLSIIALTDHNTVKNSKEFKKLAKENDITAINGVEIDSLHEGRNLHILGLGIDIENPELLKLLSHIRDLIEMGNRKLIEEMSINYDEVSLKDYDSYTYPNNRGGWKSINYIYDKKISKSLLGAFSYLGEYDCTMANIDLPSISHIVEVVQEAGGIAVLAHPGVYFKNAPTKEELLALLGSVKNQGIDAIECYHTTRFRELTNICIKFCNENGLKITGGCDFHGSFLPKSHMGSIKIYSRCVIKF